jgi:hypothetical protein
MIHLRETDLALYASGDLPAWRRFKASIHVRSCDECRAGVEAFRAGADDLRATANDLPEGLNWDRLSAEMTANIHLGLAAGECVSPREAKPPLWSWNWRPAAVVAGLLVVFASAWWLNMPQRDWAVVVEQLADRGPFGGPADADFGPMVQASETGIEFRDKGTVLGVSLMDADGPVAVTVSNTEASARYVDDDTGQVMITTVYVQ